MTFMLSFVDIIAAKSSYYHAVVTDHFNTGHNPQIRYTCGAIRAYKVG